MALDAAAGLPPGAWPICHLCTSTKHNTGCDRQKLVEKQLSDDQFLEELLVEEDRQLLEEH